MEPTLLIIIYVSILLIIGIIGIILVKVKARQDKKEEEKKLQGASLLQLAAIDQAKKQLVNRGMSYFIVFFSGVIFSYIGVFYEWLMKPKKILIGLAAIIVGGGIWGYLFLTTQSGEIVVEIRGPAEQIPPQMLKGVKVTFEARDRTKNDYAVMSGVSFSYKKGIDPSPGKVILTTNKDGIVFAKYEGRFNDSALVFTVKTTTASTPFETVYSEDSTLFQYTPKVASTINLRKKKQLVHGSMPLNVSLGDLKNKLELGSIAPDKFSIDIYCLNPDGKPSQNAKFFLGKSNDIKTAAIFENRLQGTFSLADQELSDKPFYLFYELEDSSKIRVSYNVMPPKDKDFNFKNSPDFAVLSEKGGPAKLPKPIVDRVDTQKVIIKYTFRIVDEKGSPFKNSNIEFKPKKGDLTTVKTNEKGEVVFPNKDIEDIKLFWSQVISYDIVIENPQKQGALKRSMPFIWKPRDPKKELKLRLEFNTESRQISQRRWVE